MKPFIGIFPCFEDEETKTFLKTTYTDEIIDSGGIPVILPLSSDADIISSLLGRLDGIIFSGGADIAPEKYGEGNSGKSRGISALLDECEEAYIQLSMEKDIPILGICRGLQALNVFCGGSLYQDIPSETENPLVHSLEKPEVAFHDVIIECDSPLSRITGCGKFRINSYHHQSVKDVAPGFSVAAKSEDGIVESIFCRDKKFVLGVQWHPERDHSKTNANKIILDEFIKICSGKEV